MTTGEKLHNYSASDSAIAGTLAAAITRFFTAPLDVLKIRFQLQSLNSSSGHRKYGTILQGINIIAKEEGWLAFWKGNLSATYLWIGYSAAQFCLYDWLKASMLHRHYSPTSATFWSGFVASVGATAITYPLDLMRTQFAIQGSQKVHSSLLSFVQQTFKQHGVRGFYSGMPAALVGIGPYMGLNFALYEYLKEYWKPNNSCGCTSKLKKPTFFESIRCFVENSACGAISGGISKLVVYPLDTLKRRTQLRTLACTFLASADPMHRAPEAPPLIGGMWHTARTMWRQEGLAGFYKGVAPTALKSVASTALLFATFEVNYGDACAITCAALL